MHRDNRECTICMKVIHRIYIHMFRICSGEKMSYKFSAQKAGKNCNFVAEAATSEEAVKKTMEHAKACSACSGLSEGEVKGAVEQVQA
jgi:predicted small metal-binding protein